MIIAIARLFFVIIIIVKLLPFLSLLFYRIFSCISRPFKTKFVA